MAPINNAKNRRKLAEFMATQLGDVSLFRCVEHYFIAVWEGKIVDGFTGDEAFERDCENYGSTLRPDWDETPDPDRIPMYRCCDCHSTAVEDQYWRDINWPFTLRDGGVSTYFHCRDCEERRGDGTIRYIQKYDPIKKEWKDT